MSLSAVGTDRAATWRHLDGQLLLYIGLLLVFGIVMGFSAAFDPGERAALGQPMKTVIWAAIGLTIFFVAASLDYHWLEMLAAPLYLVAITLLVLTLMLGTRLFGAQMSVKVAGLDFQFSEICKVLMIVVLASYLSSRRGRIGRLRTILGAVLLIGVPTILVFSQPDLGTALVYVAICAGMLFMSGASLGWMGLLVAMMVLVAPIAVGLLAAYQRARFLCFLDPYADPQGACYQLVQSLNAVGSGGLFGQGLTAGRQNQLGFLPVQSTDFIFTVVAEELGFLGGVVLLALFGLLIWRILWIGWRARDALGAVIASGLASLVLFQVLVNIGMVTGIMPVTGVPLPFITYGGSSLISLLFGLGICESIRIRSRRPAF